MGSLFIFGDEHTAPVCSFNHSGKTKWSGKSWKDLSMEDLSSIKEFCVDEAGHSALRDRRNGVRDSMGPFHVNFLGGLPCEVWNRSYNDHYDAEENVVLD